jgi:DNA recombination protein RmuC
MLAIAIIVGILVAAVLMIGFFYFLSQKFMLKLTNLHSEQRKGSREEVESGVKSILENHGKLLSQTIRSLEKELAHSRNDVSNLKEQNVAIREQLTNTAKITEGLQVSTEGLKNLLSNNRLRGEWGEQVAEDLLMAAGFVEKVNYTKQTSTNEGRPDFTILLPDGYRLNVDAKFPFDDLITYQEAETQTEKKRALSAFNTAIKNKVKGITSKDYIDPENQTLDFVIMFIPNEMIFSFVYEKLPNINQYCSERKVVLAGPFGFTAVLRLVLQAHKNFHHEKSLVQILGLISKFQEEYAKFGDSMEKLGKQIDIAQRTYLEVEGTRNRQLTRVVEQISHRSQASLESQDKPKAAKQLKLEN